MRLMLSREGCVRRSEMCGQVRRQTGGGRVLQNRLAVGEHTSTTLDDGGEYVVERATVRIGSVAA